MHWTYVSAELILSDAGCKTAKTASIIFRRFLQNEFPGDWEFEVSDRNDNLRCACHGCEFHFNGERYNDMSESLSNFLFDYMEIFKGIIIEGQSGENLTFKYTKGI